MGFRDLEPDEIDLVLEKERVIRTAFHADGEHFVVPMFYVWHDGALCGLTTPGRKTRLARANPAAGFQVDSTFATGPWEWASVSGQGRFEQVAEPTEFGPFAARLRSKLADSPAWAQVLLQERFERIGLFAWRIRPDSLSGRAHEPD